MGNENKLSQAESEIMELLWRSDAPVTVNFVIDKLGDGRKYTTVSTFLTRLCKKGFVSQAKNGAVNEYTAIVSREEYKRRETQSFVNEVHKGSAKSLIASLYEDRLSDGDIDELIKWIESR